ncbi:TMV resistance protein N isoform X2 [Prunus persica]|uniref:TMV resistance protein N isoform X2 n=1 Tax=Prunus persica TaxID=3760 RepID=UPI0009AB692E|nr:TMV resistance protein N isoform X2 [Prunus persica]
MALSTQRASTSRTSAELAPPRWKHDVFLSFRGEDTRRGFISHLDRALAYWQAMGTFKDDRELEVGATISLELLTEIEESYLAIIVLSPNYASSTWCLDELSKILECMEDTKRILPILYDVDPSDVRHQRESFAEAFTKHEERFSGDAEKLNRWRDALTKVANLTGLDSKTYKSEAELVDDIVKRVWKKVNPTFTLLDSQEKLVGIDSALDQLRLYLAPEENDVRFIGIWGMAGVGKTTLANLVYEKISHHFEHCCFLYNVRKKELSDLQRQLLSPLLNGNHIWDEREGTVFINKVLRNKKVLLVLDDVDKLHQLEVLARDKILFGVGSRIIITTRDKRLLVQHGTTTFKVKVLKNEEALELFSRHAFQKDQPEEGFQELSQHFLYYANGLPLALKILGRALYGRDQDAWKSALYNLNKIPDPDIFDSLKGTGAIEAIVLCLAKLETVRWNCTDAFNEMHGLRLLHFDYVVFSSGPKFLPNSLRHIQWSWYPSKSLPSGFKPHLLSKLEMWNSKLVRLWDGAKDFPNLKSMDLSFSHKLTSIPDFTRIPNLEELNLNDCKKLSEVHSSIAVHKKLKVLILDECKSIKCLPSALEMDSLEYFSFWGCSKVKKIPEFGEHMQNLKSIYLDRTAIEQIPSSIEHLVGLDYLCISYCKSLLGLPSAICNLKSLRTLDGNGCSKVDKLPGEMESLEELNLYGSGMREPLVVMKNLKILNLSGSVASRDGSGWGVDPERWGLVLSSLNRLGSLTDLDLSFCNIGEGAIPDDIGCLSSLKELDLRGNKFVSLPSSIRFLSELQSLRLQRCKRLEQLPDLPPKRSSLFVHVDDCTSLKRLSDPSKLSEGANVYDFIFTCRNCFRLVEEEGWINRIFAMIMRLAAEVHTLSPNDPIVWPGSEIPDWFDNQSVGDSIIVVPPLPPQTCSDWVGIAFCVVFEDYEHLKHPSYNYFQIRCSWKPYVDTFIVGDLRSQHLLVFYLPKDPYLRDASNSHQLSFEGHYWSIGSSYKELKTSLIIKKCGTRLVYKRDLEEFSRILKIPMPAVYGYDDEAGPIDSESGSSDEEN